VRKYNEAGYSSLSQRKKSDISGDFYLKMGELKKRDHEKGRAGGGKTEGKGFFSRGGAAKCSHATKKGLGLTNRGQGEPGGKRKKKGQES